METVEGFLKAGMKRSLTSTTAEVAGTEQLEEPTALNNPKMPLISCSPPLAPAIVDILQSPVFCLTRRLSHNLPHQLLFL